jgi:hypothetical protein
MLIAVTWRAVNRKPGKLLLFFYIVVFPEMANLTIQDLMGAGKLKRALWMIKYNSTPALLWMAVPALLTRVKLLWNIDFMNILMAVNTPRSYLPETPLILFFMALVTGNCFMWPQERKYRSVVLFQGKCKQGKAPGTVALRTINHFAIFCKLAQMIILMAVGTEIMFNRISIFYLMAWLTGYLQMLILQWITCFAVVKVTDTFNRLEGILVMAPCTILAKLVFVRILMTVSTWGKRYTFELLKLFTIYHLNLMAFITFSYFMLPVESESGLVVIESGNRFECLIIVAAKAVRW